MSDEIQNQEIIPAMLEPGEPLISEDQLEKFQDYINETLTEKYNQAVEEAKEFIQENVITTETQNTYSGDGTVQGITAVANGVIGTGKVTKKTKKSAVKDEPKVEKVAVYSTKNVTWSAVGKVYRGYNIVTKEQADQWLTRSHIRLATPEEVAREFNQ